MVAEVLEPDKVDDPPESEIQARVVRLVHPSAHSAAPPPEQPPETAKTGEKKETSGPSMTQRMLAMVAREYDVRRSREGRAYAERKDNPGWALAHSKGGAFMAEAKEHFFLQTRNWPSSTASAAVADRVEGQAMAAPEREISKRCSYSPERGRVVLDMGDGTRRVIDVTGDGFTVTTEVPDGTLFERTPITGAMPMPADRGDLGALWRLVPVAQQDRPVLLAVMLTAWLTGLPCPVTLLTGPAGAGKTTSMRILWNLIDPVTIERGGSLPTTEDAWKARLTACRAVAIDNMSGITPAVSDLLCVVATGGEASTRTLYTNAGIHVTNVQAPVMLTSVDVGALRGDLGSRMVRIELEALDATRRRPLADLDAQRVEDTPAILRGLLDLLADVLRLMPTVDRTGIDHRMADYVLVLRCVDQVLGTHGEVRLSEQADDIAGDVLATDVLARALITGVERDVTNVPGMAVLGEHTPRALLTALTWWVKDVNNGHLPQGWPRTEGVMAGHLRRLAPALEAVEGITVTARKSNGRRTITVARTKS